MKVVVLTGAGISAESGLKTFREQNGLWENHRIEEVATPNAFQVNPQLVHQFYNLRRAQLLGGEVKPNGAHLALAELEEHLRDDFLLVTQNVDNLHEQAGSKRVLHMHGELLKMRCIGSGEVFECETTELNIASACSCCAKKGLLRPHIVWFGEMPFFMSEIYEAIEVCDLFISIGTSGNVYPAAGFVEVAKKVAKAKTVEINLDDTPQALFFDQKIRGKASHEVATFVRKLISG